MTRTQVREHIFKLLFRVEFNSLKDMPEQLTLYFEDSIRDEEDELLSVGADIPEDDAEYIRGKYADIMDKLSDIDELINKAAKGWNTQRIGKVELAILRLAVYEVVYDDNVPAGVAIDEAVDLAKKFGQEGASSFVNGILAGVLKIDNKGDSED